MSRILTFGDRAESYLEQFAAGNSEYRDFLRARYRHGVVALKKSPEAALTYATSVTASALRADAVPPVPETVTLHDEDYYKTPEHAIIAMAEFSGLGYEIIPALRAAWRRGVENPAAIKPFYRATLLADQLYDSIDADLLPKVRILL